VKYGLVIYSNDSETVWNAFRFANFALGQNDTVKVFLLRKGVECESLDTEKFRVTEQAKSFLGSGAR
jgi:uncharacterized protein involved in oxidation of intracellular sulfur